MSTTIDWEFEFSPQGYAETRIRKTVRSFAKRCELCDDDAEELRQHLRMELFQACAKFDPAAGHWKGFVKVVVTRTFSRREMQRRLATLRKEFQDSEENCAQWRASAPNR
jgi:hypothetical protein